MFEIGTSLREARLRHGFELGEAEQATKIRMKYLRALEDERFEVLPAQTYVKGFLRSYADFLGLDGQIYVDEYNSRFLTGEDESPFRARSRRTATPRRRGVESSVLFVALAGIAAAAALVIIAWKWGGPEEQQVVGANDGPTVATPVESRARPVLVPSGRRWIELTVTATRGKGSRIIVHRNGASGRLLYDGTLERGKTEDFVGRTVWLNISNPENLRIQLNGRRVGLPGSGAAPIVALASAQGIVQAR